MCTTCASPASPLLSTLPYGLTAALAVIIGRVAGRYGDSDPLGEDEEYEA